MQPSSIRSGTPFSRLVRVLISLFLFLGLTSTPIQNAQAVSTTLFVSPTGGNTDCTEASPCAFGAAVAKIGSDGNTIQMAPGTYHGYGRQILYGVTIQGPTVAPGADPLVILDGTIDQTHTGRVLDISLASKATVNLQFLTIQNGKVTNANGAGIQCYKANLYLNGVVVRQNTTLTGGDGGGIYSSYCDLAVVNSRIEANTAAGWGGGVFVSFSTNPVLVMDSQILNNISAVGGGGIVIGEDAAANLARVTISGNESGHGGGIFAGGGNSSPFTLTDSSVHGNAAAAGGGINTYRTTTITNTTISDNEASFGGGIYANVSDATIRANLTLNHVTLAANTYGSGTGLYMKTITGPPSYSASLVARNTIFAGAPGKAVCADAKANNITSQEHNINSDNSCQMKPFMGNGDLISTDPLLGPLQDNGGATYSRALLPGSPAINAGGSSTGHDQRGFAYNGTPDVGAFEVLLPPVMEVFNQIAPPFRAGERTELYITLKNPNATPSRHSNLAFTLTLPTNLILDNPIVDPGNAQPCGGTISGNPGERTVGFSAGMNGQTAPGTDCWITLNIRGAAAGSGEVTATGASSLEAGTGLPPIPLVFQVDPASLYLPLVIH